ncbi:M1 family metallopeptidase [Ferruginibacter sp. SUN106]|uniref:M1 family metallopeptidase n=1 Tax=Ferruginibacter sp. SUN106 TaxID=2978348 RepID=UPI003D36E881
MPRFSLLLIGLLPVIAFAQPDRWQQRVKYNMSIDMDVNTNQFKGKQKLEYTNNSPDVLNKLFYHLYFNAFQPNSSMDARSLELSKNIINGRADWDGRVRDRIGKLKDNEIGFQKIISLKINGVPQPFKYHETILEVNLVKPMAPKSKIVIDMDFEAQVPLQVRRSGRDNPATGVRYSMSQWYPKLCEYDYEGWHPTPYVAREFYGVWGDYDVTINIDKNYKIGGTGVLLNANEIGWGYDAANTPDLKPTTKEKRTWHFVGNNVHDFMWAADPEYKHIVRKMPNGGPTLNVIYNYVENSPKNDSAWNEVADAAVVALPYMDSKFGKYPYPQYSFIQGGDGGMEYPMATLINGPGLGTVFHEWMHSWYQMMLGTNESMYAWMDEGFTSYAEDLVSKFYSGKSSLAGLKETLQRNPGNKNLQELIPILPEDHSSAYASYYSLVKSGYEEPLTTHADHFNTNFAYSAAAYSKGEVFMEQLGYIIGAAARDKVLLEYYNQWRFKHPNSNDFVQVAEKVSGIKLDWYKEYFCSTTKTINYAIDSLWEEGGVSKIRLRRIGQMPMPIDLQLTFKDGTTEMHYIPLNLMFGEKPNEDPKQKREVHEEWRWTHPTYIVEFKHRLTDITAVEIDPSKRMADVERKNNLLELKW